MPRFPPIALPMHTSNPSTRWRLIVTPAADGAENMALDEALMERAGETRDWVLRVYSWSTPTISLGRNQSARGRYDLERIGQLGFGVVRRPTGGRAILHHREITYSVTAPADEAGDLRESYERINRVLLEALRSLGVQAAVFSSTSRAISPGMSPCFDEPSAGELTVAGRKLAGSAQWRADGALLQHGSILVEDDQSLLATLAIGGGTVPPAPATLLEALGHSPSVDDIAVALGDAIEQIEGIRPTSLSIEAQLRARASALVVRYSDPAWTWRR